MRFISRLLTRQRLSAPAAGLWPTSRDGLLAAMANVPARSHVSTFPASTHLNDRVHALGAGLYLAATWEGLRIGSGATPEAIVAVCWAESDDWARRAFGHVEPEPVDPPPPEYLPPPSLAFMGRPTQLDFASIDAYESTLEGRRGAPSHSTSYTMSGKFIAHQLRGVDVIYYFGRPSPRKHDLPSAISIDLPGEHTDVIVISPPGARLPWD